jgi:Cu+-exporting ATPase
MNATDGSTFRDPVCGMQVQEDSPHRYELAGTMHRFCSTSCLEKFKADPSRYPERA